MSRRREPTDKEWADRERRGRERDLLRDREHDPRLPHGPYHTGRVMPVRYDED